MKNRGLGEPSTLHEMFLISKENASNQTIKKKNVSRNEGNHVKPLPDSKPVAMSMAFCSSMSSQDHSRNQPIGAAKVEKTGVIHEAWVSGYHFFYFLPLSLSPNPCPLVLHRFAKVPGKTDQ